ncbi:UNVERIFIED_CONTAM: hypothetical protein FKN15_030931 [Acipenser sinensis]
MGKARVAPLKTTTIPRMELTAATMAGRMDKMLRRELQLQLEDSMFWTDSTAVLKYIKNKTTRFHTFVANRISAILKMSEASQWRYVNTAKNPADHASRGLKVDSFMRNEAWISGPDFLVKSKEDWPEYPDLPVDSAMEDPEVRRDVVVNTLTAEEELDTIQQMMEHFSSWIRLKRAVAWVLKLRGTLVRFCQKRKELSVAIAQSEDDKNRQKLVLDKEMQSFKASLDKRNVTVKDLKDAELEIIRYSQRKKFPEEISTLQKGESVKKSSHIYKLNPVLQDGVLRVGGRLSRAAMPEESKHPAILSKDLHVAELILREIHQDVGHSGRNHMLSKLRLNYWIPGANAAIRRVLSKCVVCRRFHGAAGRQQMADLPQDRVLPDEPPFTNTGVDYFGPFEVRRGRSVVKRYGVIFTCMAIRAVHIEVASSLDTDSFINALRRFIARRGQVSLLRSDNGTNFIGAERELREAIKGWNCSKIKNTLLQNGIKWMFNPPTGSHHGGVWERLIRSVRKILNATLRVQALDEEGLHTVLCEAEAIINSRPITKASNDPNDLEALTPNHLLLLKIKPSLPPGLFQKEDLYSRRRWKQVQYMSDLFWKRWTREYLPQLQERQKWSRASRNFVVGDVVLVVDDSAPRNSWVMGKVIQVVPDRHGFVRQVRIKTKTSVLYRPITKVCLLQEAE